MSGAQIVYERLLTEAKKWKAKAIEERCEKNMDDRGPNGECRAREEHRQAGYPRCVRCLDTCEINDCPMLGWFRKQATRELEEEIK